MFFTLSTLIVASIGLIAQANGQIGIGGIYPVITFGGTACPTGSFVKYGNSSTAFVFEPYTIRIGPGIDETENRANCQINVETYPGNNMQYGASSSTYSGAASLDNGVSGALESIYYFSGSKTQVSTNYNLTGKYNAKYNVTVNVDDSYGDEDILWSACGNDQLPLNINHEFLLTSTNASAYGYIQSDGNFVTNIVWRACVE